MFQKAGVPLPKDSWDWNEMLMAAQKLTNASQKQWGIWMQNSAESYWGPLMLSAGGNWFNKDHTKTAFADGDGLEGFKFAVELVTKYKVSPTPADSKALTSPETSNLFVQGHVAMTPANSGAIGTYNPLVKDRFKWQPIPQPAYPKNHGLRTTFNDQPNVINTNAKDVEGAVKFAVFMSGDYVQGLIADLRGSTPVLRKLQQTERYLKAPPSNMQQIITNVGFAEDLDFTANWLEWWNAFHQQTDLAFVGEATPEDAFKKAIEAGDKVLAKG
jgi:multiple sugar transport system substrate-binding protein